MTNGMTVISPSTSRLGGGARSSRRLGAAAPLGATRPSASSFIGRNTAVPRAATKTGRIMDQNQDDTSFKGVSREK
jgi:hypothetical protein